MKNLFIARQGDGNYYYEAINNSNNQVTGIFPANKISFVQEIETFIDNLKSPKETALNFIIANASDEDKLNMVNFYPDYNFNYRYKVGDEFKLNNILFRVIQEHVSQSDWNPNTTPALYLKIAPPGVIPNWVQPTGAHDAYNIGDHVMFESAEYVSLINANSWSPTAYPAGWQLVV